MKTLGTILRILGAAAAVLYLLNPTAGVLELIPDTLPIVGNLDEAAAVGLLITCVRGLRAGSARRADPAEKDHRSQSDAGDPP